MRSIHDKLTGCNILHLIRSGSAPNFGALLTALEIAGEDYASLHYRVLSIVSALANAGLVEFGMAPDFPITLSPNWGRIQTALGISLTELAKYSPDRSMVLSPYFGHPRDLSENERSDVFVLMPFADSLKPVYDDHIKSVVTKMGLSIRRADDFFTADSVMKDIWAAVTAAQIVIADCTGRNPNVFYEIGLAHTVGRPVVLITQDSDDVPFDLRHIRYLKYELTPRGMKEFENKLGETLSSTIAGDDRWSV
jgi:hypothetical protein